VNRTPLEHAQERAYYWHEQYRKANQRANASIAEAKKSKERELTAIRLMLKFKDQPNEAKKYKDMLDRIGVEYCVAMSEHTFTETVYEILEELNND
jgi:hypothetical protein